MAKVSGITSAVTIDDSAGAAQDISADILTIAMGTPTNLQDVSSIDLAAMQRIALRKDYTLGLTGVADFAADMSHDVFKANPVGDLRTVVVAFASAAATLTAEMVLGDFSYSLGADGSLTWSASLSNGDGSSPVWS
jgi:hypothetical protein